MAKLFSIDLGIDVHATGGRSGTPENPQPLQMALVEGELHNGTYFPLGLASFGDFLAGDGVILRVFDISQRCGLVGRVLKVTQVETHFTGIKGEPAQVPWTSSKLAPFELIGEELALDFATPSLRTFPCFRESGPSLHTLTPSDEVRTFLLSVRVAAEVSEQPGQETWYTDDPEMIVGPDGNRRQTLGNAAPRVPPLASARLRSTVRRRAQRAKGRVGV